jgi:hypothetical protein
MPKMITKEEIKNEIAYIVGCFPNYEPVLDGCGSVFVIWSDFFSKVPNDKLHEAVMDCCGEVGRKYAPSIGEIKHAVNELKYKGRSKIDRMTYDMGIKPASEVIAELGIGNITDEEQKAKNAKFMAERDQK